MVVDTSAVMAILLGEPEAETFIGAIAADGKRLISSFSALECAIVMLVRKGEAGLRELDLFFHAAEIDQVNMDNEQVLLGREAYQRFGRTQGSAKLNIGDCCSYALAKRSGEVLLYKGDDFSATDIRPALVK